MAEAFLQILVENLSSLIQGEIGLIMGVDEEMNKLSSTLTTIRDVLADAEMKLPESRAIQNWLVKLNDLAYETDDILDECTTEASKLEHKNSKYNRYSLKKILFRLKIGRRMKQVTEKLDAVAAEREKFHLREMPIEKRIEVGFTRETGSVLNESHHVYGRDEDREKIVEILVNQVKDNEEISILPIIGVVGLGKTTLVQLVFNDQRVIEHFDKRIWVCVSDNFDDMNTLIKAMIEYGTRSASDLEHLAALQCGLMELLNKKRYLIVLDDVWNDDQEKWSELRNVLACGSTGSSIILTTRVPKVADIMRTLPAHHLTGLSEEHCWMLLRERAFGQEKEEFPELEAIGKQIVKKCAGVPLAAKALGGLLRFKRTEKDWNYVKESEIWELPQETLILPALRLSYHHLPLEFRQCFAYCAVFPKDSTIHKKELIFLWMAHGYIPSKGVMEVEDVGNDVCNELVLRSLLQYDPYSSGKAFNMHDLVHDLAQSIMENKIPGTQLQRKVRSASDHSKIRQVNLRNKSIAFPASNQSEMDMSFILTNFCRLRTLDASFTKIKDLPSAVGNLKHLRQLNLSRTGILSLPDSICSLWNLQVLNLDYCAELVALPKKTRQLINLRHLILEDCTSLREMPSKIRELTCLRTLSQFIVGHNRGNQLEELQCLNLGGRLKIRHLERVENPMDAKKVNLAEKKNLRKLSLDWESDTASRSGEEDKDEKVLEALEPHPNQLVTLEIRGFRGRCFPVWMSNSTLEKVVKIQISDCENCLHLPQLGELPNLKILGLSNLAAVEYIVEDEKFQSGSSNQLSVQLFPSLERLDLYSLPNLKGLLKEKVVRETFPNLEELHIVDCTSLVLPPLSSSSLIKLKSLSCTSSNLAALPSKLETPTHTDLSVRVDKNMKCIQIETLQNLTNLKELSISGADELCLPEEGLRALKSLKWLRISECETLTCVPEGWLKHLTALEQLVIIGCPELVELPEGIKYLNFLRSVTLSDLPKMECLPEALQHLSSSLQSLFLYSLHQLNSLPDWLDNLTSLDSLSIWDCPKIESLPASIRGMPNLQYMTVYECPELERRCERGKGEDWPNISHIPNLCIR